MGEGLGEGVRSGGKGLFFERGNVSEFTPLSLDGRGAGGEGEGALSAKFKNPRSQVVASC